MPRPLNPFLEIKQHLFLINFDRPKNIGHQCFRDIQKILCPGIAETYILLTQTDQKRITLANQGEKKRKLLCNTLNTYPLYINLNPMLFYQKLIFSCQYRHKRTIFALKNRTSWNHKMKIMTCIQISLRNSGL